MFEIKLLQLRLEMKNNKKVPCFYRGDYITQNRVITDMEHGTCKMFQILFYRWRIFLQLLVRLRICGMFYNFLSLVRSVSRNLDCNKRGQTSRSVVGTEIQTSCNFKANLRYRFHLMAFLRWLFRNVLLESLYNLLVWQHIHITVSYNLYFLLHKDFSHSPSSKSSTRPCSTTEPNKSTEHDAIQKGSVHCTMVATDAGRLLSSLCHRGCFVC